eukprot:3544792-Pyramimonas_sp.AAC.1
MSILYRVFVVFVVFLVRRITRVEAFCVRPSASLRRCCGRGAISRSPRATILAPGAVTPSCPAPAAR